MAKGRGGRGGRSSGPAPRPVQVSKTLSWLLRHGAEQEGLKIEKGGFVNLADVLSNRKIKSLNPPVTISEIRDIVATNEKQRFALRHVSQQPSSSTPEASNINSPPEEITDVDPKNYLIRANQGHSLDLGPETAESDLLTPLLIDAPELPSMVVHGTRRQVWPQIVASGGLKPMTRHHVHFATGVPASLASTLDLGDEDKAKSKADERVVALPEKKNAPLVVSGMRETSTLLIFLDLKKALRAGLEFWKSENGVVLSKGDERGIVALDFFEKVQEKGGKVLVKDGEILEKKK